MTIAELLEKEKEVIKAQFETQLKEIQEQSDLGSVGDAKWVKERLGTSFELIIERILYPFRKELEGRIVYYPEAKGVKWRFNKYLFNKWMNNNFERINWGVNK